jgi:glycosyltransferase involved in cell wall biosynthesis
MKKLKVLFIAGWYPSENNPTFGIFVKEHAKAVALYNEIVVLCCEWADYLKGKFYRIDDSIEDEIRTIRLHCRKSPIPMTSYYFYLLGVFGVFQNLTREGFKPDIIHAHIYTSGFPAVILGKIYGIPVIITEHFSGFPRKAVKGLHKLLARFDMNHAALITPVSENLCEHLKAYGIRNKFTVIPNAVDTQLFYPIKSKKIKATKRLLLVAMLLPIKGIPYLLEALAHLHKKRNDFVLDVVGDGPNAKEYKELAFQFSLEKVVNFHGIKTKEEVAEFMRKADFFVLPSKWENLPCVLIEAMASGLPIVATNVGGIPELINDNVGILVPPRDAEALAVAINHLLDHSDKYSSEKIASYAYKQFSYRIIGRQLDAIYRRLALHV